MRKAFMCSLCRNGVLGGALYLDDLSITYRTGKLTVEEKYKNYVIPLEEVKEVKWKWVVFPVATFTTTDHQTATFLIYNKKRFIKYYNEVMKQYR